MNKTRKAVVFCPCGQIQANGNWQRPSIDLAGFIRELVVRELATFTFVKMMCPDCFVQAGKGEYYAKPHAS
ncbi:MAG TPA: hypothetical protein VJ464_13570 [Blastocatellia bacterium]|nr:hypothetical protein [Blastocatellia bacterium]